MSTQKKKQKKRGRTGLILMLVILVLLLAIAAVLALYLRAPADTAPVLPSPASVEEAEPAPDVAVPTVTPYRRATRFPATPLSWRSAARAAEAIPLPPM